MSRALSVIGVAVLVLAWAGPLPSLIPGSFAAHMVLHMSVVGIGVPLLALGLALRPMHSPTSLMWPIVVSILDFVVIWGWHSPYLHHLSRTESLMLALEQASFAGVALLVWFVALAGSALAGAISLFFTSMHMTVLGALIGLAPRPIYPGHHHAEAWLELGAMQDQQVGGVVMLAIGGVVYLSGALWLVAGVLRPRLQP
jgi:putative membrane protein